MDDLYVGAKITSYEQLARCPSGTSFRLVGSGYDQTARYVIEESASGGRVLRNSASNSAHDLSTTRVDGCLEITELGYTPVTDEELAEVYKILGVEQA